MKKTTFTDTMIRKLKPAEAKYSRSEGNGFTVRVMPSGVKTFLYLYAINGRRREMALGHYDPGYTDDTGRGSLAVLREKFENARRKVNNGIDPLEEEAEAERERLLAPTVAELVMEYLEKHAIPNKRSWAEDKRCLEKEVIPLWGKRKAKEIRKRDVVALLDGIVKRGSPVMANNVLEKVRRMFNFGVEKDILEFSPCFGVKKPTKKEHKDRVLTDAEILTLWHGLDQAAMSDEIRRALRLILITAQRPGEVIGMHSDEIDGEWWTIPADRAKNGKAHRVFLTETAREIIGDKTGYIFQSPVSGLILADGTPRPPQSMESNAVAYAVRRSLNWPMIDAKGKPLYTKDGKPATINRTGVDDWTPHDLRRTAATNLAALGYTDEVIDAVLNHAKKGVVAIYNRHRYDAEKKGALEAWERKLNSIITGTGKSKVIPIEAAKGKVRAAA